MRMRMDYLGLVLLSLVIAEVDLISGEQDDDISEEKPPRVTLSKYPVLIVISFDGFRFNYFDRTDTPNLDMLRAKGSSVPFMRNQFVTKTFPNHMSIATGLHAESHGVVDNAFFDPVYNKTLHPGIDEFWNFDNKTLPLWTVNELAGEGRRSGVMMWPGSNFAFGSKMTLPSRYKPWNESIPFEWRVDQVINWITDDKEPVNVVFMYFEEPDEYAHGYGPESDVVTQFIQKLDNTTGYFIEKLKKLGIFERVNLMFLSDHGFQEVRQQDMIDLSGVISKDLYDQYGSTPVLHILPKPGQMNEVYKAFKSMSSGNNFSVYNKDEMVPSWHYANNRRIMPIILVADLGFVFDDFRNNIKGYNAKFNLTPSPDRVYGVHGYDNRLLPMHPFFLSHGPLFKSGFIAQPFQNVDLFPLMCKIIGVSPPPNNGTFENVQSILGGKGFGTGGRPVGWAVGAGLVFGITILLGIMSLLVTRHRNNGKQSDFGDGDGYRYININRRDEFDIGDESDNEGNGGTVVNLDKEEYQALLVPSGLSTEEV